MKPWTIAIDGPAGAGKSTVARLLAARLGYQYIDSGAMYRAVALKSRRQGIASNEEDQIAALARSTRIHFLPDSEGGIGQHVLLDDEDVTETVRTPEIASLASIVSAIPGVRTALVSQQQSLGVHGGVVMEGRDIGTVVFPNAELKIFLTASPEERAARRHRDITARGNVATLEQVRADQDERDERDSTRTIAPLAPAPDAIQIESDDLDPDAVVKRILENVDVRANETIFRLTHGE